MTAPRRIQLGPDRDGYRLLCEGDKVLGFGCEPLAAASDAMVLPCPDAEILPGWVNAHTHLYSGLAGLGMPVPAKQPGTFLQTLEEVWWRLDRALDARSLRAAARLYVAEALLAGTSSIVDHHESPRFIEGSLEVLADACQELGIRALLCYGATERNGGADEAHRGLAECSRFIHSNRRPLIRGLVGLHASFTVSDETIRAAGRLCRSQGSVLHVHVAEDEVDVIDARNRGYQGPLERLDQLHALRPGSILAHGVHLGPEETRMVDKRHAWLVQNPRSNRGNRVGYPMALRHSTRVALGTDGFPANMPDELAVLAQDATLHGEAETVAKSRALAGRQLVEDQFRHNLVADAGAFGATGLRHLIVGGRLVVRDGRLVTADLGEIREEASLEAERLWKRMQEL